MVIESCKQTANAFRVLVRLLHEANHIAEGDADAVISQYEKFVNNVLFMYKSLFLHRRSGVDNLYHHLLAGKEDYAHLRLVVQTGVSFVTWVSHC